MKKIKKVINKLEMDNDMAIGRSLRLRLCKLSYLSTLYYYDKEKARKEIFHNNLINFFEENKAEDRFFKFREKDDKAYKIAALKIEGNFIFGKLWRLREHKGKEYDWDGEDYIEKPKRDQYYIYNYFIISLDTHHMLIQHQGDYSSLKVIWVLKQWYDRFYQLENGLEIKFVKDERDFIQLIKQAYKITHAKFTVWPSNYDFDFLSKPLDDELHKKKIDKLSQEMNSKEGIPVDFEKPDIVSSAIAQSLRGNGKDPEITVEDEKGNEHYLKGELKNVVRQMLEVEKEKMLEEMSKVLKDALNELRNKNA